MDKAREWLLQNTSYYRVWDIEGGTIPDGSVRDSKVGEIIRRLTAEQYKKKRHLNPAFEAVLSTLVEGSRVDFDTACKIQSRYFTQVCLTRLSPSGIAPI